MGRKYASGVRFDHRLESLCHLRAIGPSKPHLYRHIICRQALGCREFLATVQHQNARFFQRLHWEPLEEVELFGMTHVRMRADPGYYQPAASVF